MKLVAPMYYTAFHCVAGACRHSCCIGWEIDIDEETAARYRSATDAFGDRLRKHICFDEGGTYFLTDEHGRCPFLNRDGLCDIILTYGEDALCQICADHPRFRRDLSDRTELGIGLCCEAAAQLILQQQEPFSLITLTDDAPSLPLADDDRRFLQERDHLLAVAVDRSRSLGERENVLLTYAGRQPRRLTASQWQAIYRPLERLDAQWDHTLDSLTDAVTVCENDTVFEHILCYFLYRHIEKDGIQDAVAFAVQSTRLLKQLYAVTDGSLAALAELCRRYSAEIEYSTENLDILFDTF